MTDKNCNNYELDLATAPSRMSQRWSNRKWRWGEFVRKCANCRRTDETVGEYARMTRDEQSAVKDVGGFVGGYLSGGSRKSDAVLYRSCATLDLDYGTADAWDEFTQAFGCAAVIYSTHTHTPDKPRYRLVIPFSRNVTPTEYEPICRRIAQRVGIEMFDGTTYQTERLFYWPSAPKDGEYFFQEQKGEPLDVDRVLATYVNFADVSEWPRGTKEKAAIDHEKRKKGEPTEKPGLIGAFCRAYSIEEAIEKFLPDKYEPTAAEGRYTYRLGSVAGGLICFDHVFAYSYHSTDPASMELYNAFDLVRVHMFGIHDEGSRVQDVSRLPSYQKMQDFAAEDPKVRLLLMRERLAEARDDFDDTADTEEPQDEDGASDEWMAKLDFDKKGNIYSSAKNIITVLENDPRLKGHLWHDDFSGFDMVSGGLPWDRNATQWSNRDDANLRIYMENRYGITGKDRIRDAKEAVLTMHRRHPIREYLGSLVWDGVPRLDRLIIDYIGAEDTPLNRAMTRKQFVAAVARVMQPGCKYDYCLIMTGPEGIGKSTLLHKMAGGFFNDSLVTTEGKEGMEQIRRSWIIELGELSSIKRGEVDQVKNYISRTEDVYRPAYGTVVERYLRQCVFFGTTNEELFLKGDTGNRRFWVIRVNPDLRRYSDWMEAIDRDRDQLWAEAGYLYEHDEPLYLDIELEKQAREVQRQYNDDQDDPMRDMLEHFLEIRLPADWSKRDLASRRAFLNNPDPMDPEGIVEREVFCIPEFLCEFMGRNMSDKEYKYMARKIGKLVNELEGWEKVSSSRHASKLYGTQRAYKRVALTRQNDDEKETEDFDDI